MNLSKDGSNANKSQAELLYEAQQRKRFRFRRNVILSWFGLLLFLVFLFSGTEIQSANGVTSISSWSFQTVKENNREVRKKIEETLVSIPIGLSNQGLDITTITVDR